jgi:3D (Asp-Asp-Asp) domain-containing protein
MTAKADSKPSWKRPLLVRCATPLAVVLLLAGIAATAWESVRLLLHGQGKVQLLAAIDAAPAKSVGSADAVTFPFRPSPPSSSVTPSVAGEPSTTPSNRQVKTNRNVAKHSTTTAMFDGRPIKPVHQMTMRVTAYSPDERSCGDSADGITASGYSVWTNGMKMAAADKRILSFGALVSVDGYHQGKPVPVLDRGGAIKGHHIDLLMPTDAMARKWGSRTMTVTIWDYAD